MADTLNEQNDQNTSLADEFDAVFDELAGEGGETGNTAETETPVETEQETAPEPTSGDEQQQETPKQEEPSDWQHKYDSMMGRFKAAQQENKELRDRLTALEEAEKKRQQAAPKEEEPEPTEDLDGIAEEYRPMFKEKGADGDRMRKMLEDFGPEYAQNYAETVKIKRDMAESKEQIQRQIEDDRLQKHRDALAKAAPEFADAIQGRDEQGWNDLINGVRAWIDTLPYAEGAKMTRIADSGTTAEVADMLGKYSQFRKGSKDATRNLAKSNIAVPRTGSSLPTSTRADANDFDAAWEEAAKE